MTHRFPMIRFTVFLMIVALPFAAFAANPVGRQTGGGSTMEWQLNSTSHEKATLTWSCGDGEVGSLDFKNGKHVSLSVADLGTDVQNATCSWQLVLSPKVSKDVAAKLAAARAANDEKAARKAMKDAGFNADDLTASGHFSVEGGAFVSTEFQETGNPSARPGAVSSTAIKSGRPSAPVETLDQVIPDDLIVQGSGCFGFDCVNNESFGFDTIRLKENNLRIKFEDTSVGTFPTNDWQLTANDSASGGASKFSIEDITGSKVPVTVTAGATTNSIFVDSTGRVGFRTSTPVLDLHVNTSNTPAIRLEQNNSGGFTAQTWDIGANEANFFIRDVTGGSKLSLRIRPGAPTSSLDISADGDVGVGTASPNEKLHVFSSADANDGGEAENTSTGVNANAFFRARNDADALAQLISHGSGRTATRYGVSLANKAEILGAGTTGLLIGTLEADDIVVGTNNTSRMTINGTTGAVTIAGNLTVNGTFSNPSSRELKEDFVRVDTNAMLEKLAQVPVQEWTYKNDERNLRHVGPTVEDFRDTFGLGTDGQHMFPIDVQGVTMAAVQALYQRLLEKDAQISDLQRQLTQIQEQLERSEQ